MHAILRPSPNATPGTALLVISPWPSPDSTGLEISLQSNSTHNAHLDSDGQWQGSPHWIAISAARVEAGELTVPIGPSVVDPVLERRSSNAIRLTARLQGHVVGMYTLQVDDAVLSSAAAGLTPQLSTSGAMLQPAHEPAAPTVPEPVLEFLPVVDTDPVLEHPEEPVITPKPVPDTAATPRPPIEAQTQRANKTGLWIVLAILLLAAIGAALWWFVLRAPTPPAPATTEASTAPAAAPVVACSVANLPNAQELEFVQQCIQTGADSATLLQVITAARDAGQCGIAQRLYANRAQSGDTAIALAYAREYNPQFHSASACFGTAEPATARYWYEEILQREPDNAQAKTELEQLP